MIFDSPRNVQMPLQKVSDNEKDEKWYKDCADACENLILTQNNYTRETRRRKEINYDLYAGKLHPTDIELITNPMGLKDIAFPAKAENHPLCNPYIKALIGEEIKRRFDWSIKVENEDAVSEKEKAKIAEYMQVMEEFLTQGLQSPEEMGVEPNDPEYKQLLEEYQKELEKKLRQKQQYINYEWQDIRELASTRLLKYYQDKLDLTWKFTQGYEDALISTEEIYNIDVLNNEPFVRKCNPLNTYFLLPPDSYKVEDTDMIIEENYVPVSEVIDRYYEQLSNKNIQFLEDRVGYKYRGTYGNIPNYELQDPTFALPLTVLENNTTVSRNSNIYLPFDANNNVRVLKVNWRGLRKIGKLSFFDENGEPQETIVPETYKANKELGESVTWLWIGEWYEITKIANEIYLNGRPKPIQFRELNNLSKCSSGYVGTVYKTNSSQPQSLIDLIKPYQYMYNIVYHKFKLLLSNNIGKVLKLDLASVPDGWEPDKWLYYAKVMNVAVIDSFKEAKKGAATGKIVGNMAGHGDNIDLELGNSIQQMTVVLENIKRELDLITGISPERRGERTSADPGLGVTQENKIASANITEWYFKLHDNTKVRVMKNLLEVAKFCLRAGNKTIQYVTDEMTSQIFNVDGELINEAEYGLVIRDAVADKEALQMLRQATEIALQTGQVDVLQLMDIYSNQSMSSIRRKIEKHIQETKQAQQEQQQAEFEQEQQLKQADLQMKQQEMQMKYDLEYAKLEAENYNREADRLIKLETEQMKALAFDEGPNTADITGIGEYSKKQLELDQKSRMEASKTASKERSDMAKLRIEKEKLKQQRELELEKLKVERENMKNDEKIAKINARSRAQKAYGKTKK